MNKHVIQAQWEHRDWKASPPDPLSYICLYFPPLYLYFPTWLLQEVCETVQYLEIFSYFLLFFVPPWSAVRSGMRFTNRSCSKTFQYTWCCQHYLGLTKDDYTHWLFNGQSLAFYPIINMYICTVYLKTQRAWQGCISLHDSVTLQREWSWGKVVVFLLRSCQAAITLNGIQPLSCYCHCGSWAGNDLTWPWLLKLTILLSQNSYLLLSN